MYSLNCDYYQKEFNYLHELIDDVLMSGMDPNYEITKNGVGIKEMLNELIGVWYGYVYYNTGNCNVDCQWVWWGLTTNPVKGNRQINENQRG